MKKSKIYLPPNDAAESFKADALYGKPKKQPKKMKSPPVPKAPKLVKKGKK